MDKSEILKRAQEYIAAEKDERLRKTTVLSIFPKQAKSVQRNIPILKREEAKRMTELGKLKL